jgi:putative nucleotide binding protein
MSMPDHYQDNKGNAFGSFHVPRRYEEYAHIIEFTIRGKSSTVKKLELLGDPSQNFEIGERAYIGREGRNKIISVLGRLNYNDLSVSAKNEIPIAIEKIVTIKEKRFVDYFNNAQPITPRVHGLELIPGIGKIYMKSIITEREKKKFESFNEIQNRVGVKDLQKLITKRIVEEISGETRMNLFVRK